MEIGDYKPRCPPWGKNWCTRIGFALGMAAVIVGCVEIFGLFNYLDFLSNVESTQCCGVIKRPNDIMSGNYPADFEGAVCHENDFDDGLINIHQRTINDSIYCEVNGQICDQFGNTSFAECLKGSPWSPSHICSQDSLYADGDPNQYGMVVIIMAITGLLIPMVFFCLECVGCFDCLTVCGSTWPITCCCLGSCKVCEFIVWLLLLIATNKFLANAGQNGYFVYALSDADQNEDDYQTWQNGNDTASGTVLDYMDANCDFQEVTNREVVWVDFQGDVNDRWIGGWVYLTTVDYVGVGVAILDCLFFFGQLLACCECCRETPDDERDEREVYEAVRLNEVVDDDDDIVA